MDFLTHLAALSPLILLFVYVHHRRSNPPNTATPAPPEPPWALPIIGHLHLLISAKTPIFRTMAAMADELGPIFALRFGKHLALVINSRDAVRDCFSRNDAVFSSRPRSAHGLHLGYDFAAFGFAPCGPHWRAARRLVMAELLSPRRVEAMSDVYLSELEALVRELYGRSSEALDIGEVLEHFTLNVITLVIAGKRYFCGGGTGEAERIGKVIKEYMLISGALVVSDLVPIPEWIDVNGTLREMKRIGREIDGLIGSWIEEHKVKVKNEVVKPDFIDVMLSVVEDSSELGYSRDTIIKGTLSNLIIAGSDTTALNLTWVLSLLLNNKYALNRAQQELDLIVGRERWVQDSDIESLVYLRAIVKETLRLYPPGPLAVPHEATEDCTVCGFHVAKGTRLFANLWKLHRDPHVWPDPEAFSPERFLTSHAGVDPSGKHFEFIPFGAGRRSCPGMSFALRVTHVTLARVLQGFELRGGPVDMSEGLGITLPRATPLEVVMTPRLSSALYQ